MEVLDHHCAIPGYHQLCCESCSKRVSGPNTSLDPDLASTPTSPTPGSPLPQPKATRDIMEPTMEPAGPDDHQHGRPTQLPGPPDMRSSVIQPHSVPQTLSPRAFRDTSPTTPQRPPWGWTPASVTASEDHGQPREESRHPGTGLPATSPVT